MEIVEVGGFSATIRIFGIFRRYQTQLVRITSVGSEFGVLAGYYRPTWYATGELGFDKSITSHLKHSDVMRAFFPAIKDGWYIPSGGNYYYGIQGGKTIEESVELSLRLGATDAQFHDTDAAVPYYLQLGMGIRFLPGEHKRRPAVAEEHGSRRAGIRDEGKEVHRGTDRHKIA